MRIGTGYDIHRLVEGRPFPLGGVLLDHPRGPHGYSDGDTLAHALIDALLGAACLGDIGQHFPPGDPQWRGADSIDLLAGAEGRVFRVRTPRLGRRDRRRLARRRHSHRSVPHGAASAIGHRC